MSVDLSPTHVRASLCPRRPPRGLIHALLLCSACLAGARAQQHDAALLAALPEAPQAQPATPAAPASLAGLILDADGAAIADARITLAPGASTAPATNQTRTAALHTTSDGTGAFSFPSIPPGVLTLTVTAPGFVTVATTVTLHPGEAAAPPPITLHPGAESEIEVRFTTEEIAEEQIHQEEKQRIFGAIPNFYVSYQQDAAPLTSRQKWELAWRSSIDPFTIGISAVTAGIQQANNDFPGFGQGAAGYGKRFGAAYGDNVIGGILGNYVFATLFRQDPRYFVKGTGSVRSRVGYAISRSVLTRADNGHAQINYSGILGSIAASGISDAYYPAADRNGAGTIFLNTAIGTGSSAVVNLFQEFLVRKLTPAARKPAAPTPASAPNSTSSAPEAPLLQP